MTQREPGCNRGDGALWIDLTLIQDPGRTPGSAGRREKAGCGLPPPRRPVSEG